MDYIKKREANAKKEANAKNLRNKINRIEGLTNSNKQALKRFFYFTFANKLFVSSNQFKLEIETCRKNNWWGTLFKKKIY